MENSQVENKYLDVIKAYDEMKGKITEFLGKEETKKYDPVMIAKIESLLKYTERVSSTLLTNLKKSSAFMSAVTLKKNLAISITKIENILVKIAEQKENLSDKESLSEVAFSLEKILNSLNYELFQNQVGEVYDLIIDGFNSEILNPQDVVAGKPLYVTYSDFGCKKIGSENSSDMIILKAGIKLSSKPISNDSEKPSDIYVSEKI